MRATATMSGYLATSGSFRLPAHRTQHAPPHAFAGRLRRPGCRRRLAEARHLAADRRGRRAIVELSLRTGVSCPEGDNVRLPGVLLQLWNRKHE